MTGRRIAQEPPRAHISQVPGTSSLCPVSQPGLAVARSRHAGEGPIPRSRRDGGRPGPGTASRDSRSGIPRTGRRRDPRRPPIRALACIAEHPLGRIVPHRHAGVGVDHWRTFRKLVNPVDEFQTQLVQNSGFWAYTDGTNIAVARDTPWEEGPQSGRLDRRRHGPQVRKASGPQRPPTVGPIPCRPSIVAPADRTAPGCIRSLRPWPPLFSSPPGRMKRSFPGRSTRS